mmetsp:Transcript_20202/g.62444  ORF Transcript_20202/g.62444 Transcript_20202/m.62444 type:complete len:267 (+) Transcript_20202:405-1205(+)
MRAHGRRQAGRGLLRGDAGGRRGAVAGGLQRHDRRLRQRRRRAARGALAGGHEGQGRPPGRGELQLGRRGLRQGRETAEGLRVVPRHAGRGPEARHVQLHFGGQRLRGCRQHAGGGAVVPGHGQAGGDGRGRLQLHDRRLWEAGRRQGGRREVRPDPEALAAAQLEQLQLHHPRARAGGGHGGRALAPLRHAQPGPASRSDDVHLTYRRFRRAGQDEAGRQLAGPDARVARRAECRDLRRGAPGLREAPRRAPRSEADARAAGAPH